MLIPFALWLNSQAKAKFTGHEWTIPAKVYARPLELYKGKQLSSTTLKKELELLGYKMKQGRSAGTYSVSGKNIAINTRGFVFGDGRERPSNTTVSWSGNTVSKLTKDNDEAQSLLRLEPLLIGGIYPGHNEDRLLVTLDDTPKGMLAGLLAVEDRHFYSHFGLSIRGILRAMWVNIRNGRMTQGGSTITQQLVKNFYLTQDKKLSRKLLEVPMALMLESSASKDEILQSFLNEVFLAQDGNRAIHGFGLASQYFFNQPLKELLPHQYALLVGMIKGPSYYSPLRHPQRATARRNVVLKVMASQGVMSVEEADYAASLPLSLNNNTSRTARQPAYLDLVRRQLSSDYALEDLQTDGLRIFTNFDPLIQLSAEKSIEKAFADIEKRPARANNKNTDDKLEKSLPELEAAMLVTNSTNGEVVAVVGGKKPRFAGFNRALDAKRPIGSLIKPAVFLTAIERPDSYTLASFIDDGKFELEQADGKIWAPNNFDKQSHGSVTLLESLSKSYNLASASLGLELGVEQVHDTLKRLGVDQELPALPSLFLGALDLSLLDVATMYQTLSSGGFRTPLRAIREVLDANGESIKHYSLSVEQTVEPDAIHLLQYAMQETMRSGTGRSAYLFIPKTLATAGKTGTSNGQRDSWFAGFSGDYLAVSWMGNDDNLQTSLTGGSGALRAWSYLFRDVSKQSLEFIRPRGVTYEWTEKLTGQRSDKNCDNALYLPYITGTEPLGNTQCESVSQQRQNNWLKRLFPRLAD